VPIIAVATRLRFRRPTPPGFYRVWNQDNEYSCPGPPAVATKKSVHRCKVSVVGLGNPWEVLPLAEIGNNNTLIESNCCL